MNIESEFAGGAPSLPAQVPSPASPRRPRPAPTAHGAAPRPRHGQHVSASITTRSTCPSPTGQFKGDR